MKEKKSLTILLLFLLLFQFLPACTNEGTPGNPSHGFPTEEAALLTTPQITTVTKPSILEVENGDQESPLTIENVGLTVDDSGTEYVIGMVENRTGTPANSIQVEIRVFDDSGEIFYVEIVAPFLMNLGPGKASPFILELPSHDQKVDQIRTSIINVDFINIEIVDVLIQKESLAVRQGTIVALSGEIQNNNLNPIVINKIAAGLYDKNGKLISTSGEFTSIRYLDPGENGPFQVSLPSLNSKNVAIADFQVFVDTQVSIPFPYLDLILNGSINTYYDESNKFHIIGEITNNSDKPMDVVLIAGIYDDQGFLLDVSKTEMPTPILPNKTLPYRFNQWRVMNSDHQTGDRELRYSIQVDPFSTRYIDQRYVSLTILDKQIEYNPPQISITGNVLNNSDREVQYTTVIVTINDRASDDLLAMGCQQIEPTIPVGQIAAFDLTIEMEELNEINDEQVTITVIGEIVPE